MQVFLVHVAEDESIFRLGTLGDGAEVMARHREHLLGPLLGRGRRAAARDHHRNAARNGAAETNGRKEHARA